MKNVYLNLVVPMKDIPDVVKRFGDLKANLYAAAHGGEPDSIGPRQVKALQKAMSDLVWELNTRNIPGTDRCNTVLFPAVRFDDGRVGDVVSRLHNLLYNAFGDGIWFVSKKNVKTLIEGLQEITRAAAVARPYEAAGA